jgi:hypothetical protein
MQSSRSRRAGDGKERQQNGFLPDFRAAINAVRSPRAGDRRPQGASTPSNPQFAIACPPNANESYSQRIRIQIFATEY